MLTTSTPTTLTTSLTTPPAKLAERDNVLLGYYIVGTATSTQDCGPGELYTTSNTWAGCYASTYLAEQPPLWTECTYILDPTGTFVPGFATCTTEGCFTQTVYQTYPDNVDPMTNFFCAVPAGPAMTVYRNLPLGASGTTSASSASSSSISSPLSSSSPFTTPSSPSSTSSKAWIAGPVLGSLALIAVIGFGLWYIRNQRRHRKESSPAPQNPDQQFLPETKAELPNEDVKREGGVGGESAIPPTLATQPQAQNENLYYEMDPSQTQGVKLPSNRPVEAGRAELPS